MKRVKILANSHADRIKNQHWGAGTIDSAGNLHAKDLHDFLEEILGQNPFDYLTDAATICIEEDMGLSSDDEYSLDSLGVTSAAIENDTIRVQFEVDFRVWFDGDGRSRWYHKDYTTYIPLR